MKYLNLILLLVLAMYAPASAAVPTNIYELRYIVNGVETERVPLPATPWYQMGMGIIDQRFYWTSKDGLYGFFASANSNISSWISINGVHALPYELQSWNGGLLHLSYGPDREVWILPPGVDRIPGESLLNQVTVTRLDPWTLGFILSLVIFPMLWIPLNHLIMGGRKDED